MNILNTVRKKLTGVRTEDSIEPRPSVAITTVIDNPRFTEAKTLLTAVYCLQGLPESQVLRLN